MMGYDLERKSSFFDKYSHGMMEYDLERSSFLGSINSLIYDNKN
jgi:hypothetical protein